MQNIGIAGCGIVTSILTAIIVVTINKYTGFDLFSLSLWFIVPVGAMITGAGAACGYYFGSIHFNRRPDRSLLLQMVIIAGLTNVLIYFLEYIMLTTESGQPISAMIDFTTYLQLSLTTAHYTFGHGAGVDTGEVGNMGYVLAALQFVGFLIGGFAIYAVLGQKLFCEKCKYFKGLGAIIKMFQTPEQFKEHFEKLGKATPGSAEFATLIGDPPTPSKIGSGHVQVTTQLLGCPTCRQEIVKDSVQVFNGKEWSTANANTTRLPEGVSLRDVFRPRKI